MFRVVRLSGSKSVPVEIIPPSTSRPPGNIPYFVDNIWEWLRPSNLPSRRRSAFASPTAELAAMASGGAVADAWKVELCDNQVALQLVRGQRLYDARYHEDIGRLKAKIVRELLPKFWFDLPLSDRLSEAALFMPCASAEDVSVAIRDSRFLDEEAIRSACSFWSDVEMFSADETPPHGEGEIFFGGVYRLVPMRVSSEGKYLTI